MVADSPSATAPIPTKTAYGWLCFRMGVRSVHVEDLSLWELGSGIVGGAL